MKIKGRVLVDTIVDDKQYKPNQLVAFSAAVAKGLVKEGRLDTTAPAVKYCESQGAELIEHDDPDDVADGPAT